MFKRILVLLDGSKLSEIALPYAEELTGALNSDVVLVSVCEPCVYPLVCCTRDAIVLERV